MSELQNLIEKDFSFRTNKETGYKRPTVTVSYPVLTAVGLVSALQSEDTKLVSLICDLAADAVTSHVRSFVEADENFSQEALNVLIEEGKISLETIANLPKSERNTISKENLEEFATDYIALMPGVTGKDVKKIQTAAALFIERFKRVAGDNGILAVLQEQLGVFIENAGPELLEKHERVLSYLASKLEELLSIKVTADAL